MSGIVRANNSGQSGAVSNIETIDSDDYVDGSIDNAHIADDAIDSEHYAAGSIDNAHLADDAVDSDELAAGAVDTAHIADNQVTLAKMAGITRGSMIIGDASGDPSALAKGTQNYVLTAGANDISWVAASSGAIAWEGSQTSETTSSSASSTDILTSSTLSIAETAPFQLLIGGRKTDAGNSNWGGLGLKINTTVLSVAAINTATIWSTNQDVDRVSRGTGFHVFSSRVTNYKASGTGTYIAYHASGLETHSVGGANISGTDFPAATITAVVISAVSIGGTNVVGADELQIYELATS